MRAKVSRNRSLTANPQNLPNRRQLRFDPAVHLASVARGEAAAALDLSIGAQLDEAGAAKVGYRPANGIGIRGVNPQEDMPTMAQSLQTVAHNRADRRRIKLELATKQAPSNGDGDLAELLTGPINDLSTLQLGVRNDAHQGDLSRTRVRRRFVAHRSLRAAVQLCGAGFGLCNDRGCSTKGLLLLPFENPRPPTPQPTVTKR